MLTSYNAYYEKRLSNIDSIPADFRKYFSKHRFFVRPASEYILLYKAYDQKIENISLDDFNNLKTGYISDMQRFNELFFLERKRCKENLEHWLSLHQIYDHVLDFFKKYNENFFIVTTKDRDSVERIMLQYGLRSQVRGIYSMELSDHKGDLFHKLFEDYPNEINKSNIHYVDDNEWHLADVQQYIFNLYFANWGYAQKQYSHAFRTINSLEEIL